MSQPLPSHFYTADFSALTAYIVSSLGAFSPTITAVVGVMAGLWYATALYKEWFK